MNLCWLWRWAAWSEADRFPLNWTKASLQWELHNRTSETKSNTATTDSATFSVFSTKSLQSVLQMPHSIYKRTIGRGQRKDEFLYFATGFGSNSEFVHTSRLIVATEKHIIFTKRTLILWLSFCVDGLYNYKGNWISEKRLKAEVWHVLCVVMF